MKYLKIWLFLVSGLNSGLAWASNNKAPGLDWSVVGLADTSVTAVDGLTEAKKEVQVYDVERKRKERSLKAIKACRGINKASTAKKMVALTFDDGPSSEYTRDILRVLKKNNIRGTFFVIGKNVLEYPQVLKEIHLAGHVIGNHTYSHYNLANLAKEEVEAELTKAGKLVNKLIGKRPILYRPPYGSCSVASYQVASELSLKTIMWSAMTDDYLVEQTSPEKIAGEIISMVTPGAIIGLHDGGGNRAKTVKALEIIIEKLNQQGYVFVTVSELLDFPEYFE
jgi:Predicted xylanase/chitin deacetylase